MWQLEANCKGVYPEIFDPEAKDEVQQQAKDMYCSTCPVVDKCLQEAMIGSEFGVWGNTTESERKEIRRAWFAAHPTVRARPRQDVAQASISRFDNRLKQARNAYEAFLSDYDAPETFRFYQDNLECLEAVIHNPYSSYGTIAKLIDRSPSLIKLRFREVTDYYGIEL